MLAIIPARGGSKRLCGKNLKELNGKPLIAYTVEAAKASKYISKIIISTDDIAIADIAVKYGATCPFLRPDFLATDSARTIDVLKYTLKELEQENNLAIEEFVLLQPTSPLRTSHDIDEAIEIFQAKNADSVISFCEEHHPIKWHKYIDADGKFENIFEEKIWNRQNERTTYYPNGAIYIFKRGLISTENYYTENSYAYVMNRKKSIDIDTIEDFEYAEYLLTKDEY